MAFHGPPSGIRSHFNTLSMPCPPDYNPADFVIFSIQTDDTAQIQRIVQGWSKVAANRPAPPISGDLEIPKAPGRKGFCIELASLVSREAKNVIRDKGTLAARFGSTIFLTLIYALVFFQIGSQDHSPSHRHRPLERGRSS